MIRVRDKVKIINPIFIERVGYDNNLETNLKYVEDNFSDEIRKFAASILCKREDGVFFTFSSHTKVEYGIAKALAYEFLKRNSRDGNERKLYTKEEPFYEGQKVFVAAIKYVHTGFYIAPESSYDSYCGEYDYVPGYIDKRVIHKLLCICHYEDDLLWDTQHPPKLGDGHKWIEDCNVEKVDG